jgi:hypothetical protein
MKMSLTVCTGIVGSGAVVVRLDRVVAAINKNKANRKERTGRRFMKPPYIDYRDLVPAGNIRTEQDDLLHFRHGLQFCQNALKSILKIGTVSEAFLPDVCLHGFHTLGIIPFLTMRKHLVSAQSQKVTRVTTLTIPQPPSSPNFRRGRGREAGVGEGN